MEDDYMEYFDNNEPYYTITEYNNMKDELENKIEELENKIEELEGVLENVSSKRTK